MRSTRLRFPIAPLILLGLLPAFASCSGDDEAGADDGDVGGSDTSLPEDSDGASTPDVPPDSSADDVRTDIEDGAGTDADVASDSDSGGPIDVRPDAGRLDEPYDVVPGDPGAAASTALPDVGPFALTAEEVSDRFVTNRLTAVLAAGVTVEALNQVLAENGVEIATARTGSPAVTLRVAPMSDSAAARERAAALQSTGVFAIVLPAFSVDPESLPATVRKEAPAGVRTTHERTRLHAAWNLASQNNRRIPVMVADCYVELRPHPGISAQSFRVDARTGPHARLTGDGQISGNHGFWVSSILGADVGTSLSFGTSLDPAGQLEILSVQMCGMTWVDRLTVLEDFALTAPVWVLNASIGYNDPAEEEESRQARATYALLWRAALRRIGADRVLVVAAAGNDGDARPVPTTDVTSPFGTQARLTDVRTLVPAADLPAVDAVVAALGMGADTDRIAGHTLLVGSSNTAGARSAFSTPGEDVLVLGEDISGLCLVNDVAGPLGPAQQPPRCNNQETFSSGSSASAPQVSGIAALWLGASGRETAASVRQRMLDASANGTVDAFGPLLAVVHDDGRDALRALCDVTDDAACDMADVEALVDAWENEESTPGPDAFETWSRFDLNGDGFARTDRGTPFDLDFDGSTLGTLSMESETGTLSLREVDASDLTVLCAAAFGSAWDGDPVDRDARIGERCGLEEVPPLAPGTTWFGTLTYTSTSTTTAIGGACGSSSPSGNSSTNLSARVSCTGEASGFSFVTCTLIDGSYTSSSSRSSGLSAWGATVRLLGGTPCTSDAECGGASPRCLGQSPVCGDASPEDGAGVCGACITYARSETTTEVSYAANLTEQVGTLVAIIGLGETDLRMDLLGPSAEGSETVTSRIESRVEGTNPARPCEALSSGPPVTRDVVLRGGGTLFEQAAVTATETTLTASDSTTSDSTAFDGLSRTSTSTSVNLSLRAVVTP